MSSLTDVPLLRTSLGNLAAYLSSLAAYLGSLHVWTVAQLALFVLKVCIVRGLWS